jgi:hypothetical protein
MKKYVDYNVYLMRFSNEALLFMLSIAAAMSKISKVIVEIIIT